MRAIVSSTKAGKRLYLGESREAMGKTDQGTNYPWERWLKPGATHVLRRGVHYSASDRTMCSYVYRVARRYRREGSRVHVSVSQTKEGVIKITAHTGELDGRKSA